MSTVTLPAGTVPVRSLTTAEVLASNRVSSLRVELLDSNERSLGDLDGVDGGQVDYTTHASIKGGGQLRVVDNGQEVDWLTDRVKPIITIEGYGDTALGVFVASRAPEDWSGTGRVVTVELQDKCAILDQDKVAETYTVDAGATVTDEVVTLIESTGETNHAVTPSAATLANALVWQPGTPKLRIVNDLLAVINYFALFCDGNGQYRAEPYVRPASRPIFWEFLDGATSIYGENWHRDVDLLVPNRFVVTTRGSADTEALTASYTNDDEANPYSYPRRGRYIVEAEQGVEITDQTTLDAYARRRLIELSSPASTPEIQHAFVPGLMVNHAVRLRHTPAGVDGRHVVSKTVIPLDVTELCRSVLTEVVDI